MKVLAVTGLSNYYGSVALVEENGALYLALENWDGLRGVPVSTEFAKALVDEFGDEGKGTVMLGSSEEG